MIKHTNGKELVFWPTCSECPRSGGYWRARRLRGGGRARGPRRRVTAWLRPGYGLAGLITAEGRRRVPAQEKADLSRQLLECPARRFFGPPYRRRSRRTAK